MAAGLARGNRGNPASSIKVEQTYGIPVLLSGSAALVLKSQEDEIITSHLKMKLQNLQKLYDRTPRSFVYFLGGSLPSTTLLHMK